LILRKLLTNAAFAAWLTRGLLLILVLPPVLAFVIAAAAGFGPSANPANLRIFSWALLGRSLFIAMIVALLAAVLGGFCGTVTGRLSRAASALMLFAFVLPLATPPSVHAYVWRNVALSAGLLGGLFVEGGSGIVNYAGAVFSMVSAFWTIPALAAFAVSAGPARRYELEARPFASPSIAARRILVPSVLPAVAASAGLVFVLAFGEFGAVALWQINTFPAHVLSLYSATFEPHLAAAASLVPALVTGLAAALVFLVAARALSATAVERANVEREILWRPSRVLKALLAVFVLFLVAGPLTVSVWYAAARWSSVAGLAGILGELGFSIVFASAAALTGAAVAVFAAAAHWTSRGPWRTLILVIALAAFFLPSAGAGLAVKSVSQLRIIPAAFTATPAALVYALAARFLAVPLLLAALALSRVDANYRRLVEISGATGLRAIVSVGVPVAFPAAFAGFAVAAVLGVAELPVSMLVSPPGSPPASVDLFNLMHYARQSEAFAVAVAMSVGSSFAIIGALAITRRLWKRYLPAH